VKPTPDMLPTNDQFSVVTDRDPDPWKECDRLRAENERLKFRNESLIDDNHRLAARVAELEEGNAKLIAIIKDDPPKTGKSKVALAKLRSSGLKQKVCHDDKERIGRILGFLQEKASADT